MGFGACWVLRPGGCGGKGNSQDGGVTVSTRG